MSCAGVIATVPLESVTVRAINAILMRGWRDVMPLAPQPDSLILIVFNAVEGLFLIAIGLGIGSKLVPRDPQR